MDPQDQENFGESSTIDQAANRHESIKPGEAAGSVYSSNKKVILKIKNYRAPEKPVVDPPPPPAAAEIFRTEGIKSHRCKECNKSFSSGKALGGHMSSAHVQANKDYSYKKQKPKTHTRKSGYYSGSGPEDHVCIECGKCFPSQKSLYGHMRCHPDRDYRGMVEPRMESSQASTEPGFDYTSMNQDEDDDVGSGPDAVARDPVDFVNFLKAWPVTAKRGRSARTETVSPPFMKSPAGSSSAEEEEITAGRQLLRLLGRSQNLGVKIDQGPALDDGVNSKNQGRVYHVEKLALCEGEGNHGPGVEAWDWDEARDYKRQRVDNNCVPNSKIEDDVGKGKDKIVDDVPESEDDILLGAISVLANGKRENYRHLQPDSQRPVPENYCSSTGEKLVSPIIQRKDNSGLMSSPDKHTCCICKKVFSSHQALGGHMSSHKKLMVSIINTADDVNGNDTKPKTKNVVNGGVKIEGGDDNVYVCKVCNKVYATARALGGHKKCHNKNNNNSGNTIGDDIDKDKDSDNKGGGDGDEEKVVRCFDLNMMPDDENGDL